jgi:hypothetical protein
MSTQPGKTVATARRHLHDVLRMGTSDLRNPMLDTVESWNWAVRISVVGLFALALAGILYIMASVVVPVLLAWVVAMVLLPVVDSLERRGFSRVLTSTHLCWHEHRPPLQQLRFGNIERDPLVGLVWFVWEYHRATTVCRPYQSLNTSSLSSNVPSGGDTTVSGQIRQYPLLNFTMA